MYKLIDLDWYVYYKGTKKEITNRLNEKLTNGWRKPLKTKKETEEHGFYIVKNN